MNRYIIISGHQNRVIISNINISHNIIYAKNKEEAIGIYMTKFTEEFNIKYNMFINPIVTEIDDSQYKRVIKKLWNKRCK